MNMLTTSTMQNLFSLSGFFQTCHLKFLCNERFGKLEFLGILAKSEFCFNLDKIAWNLLES